MASPTPNYRIPRSFDFFDISGTSTNENYSIITSINSENGVSSSGWRLPIPNLLNYESDYDWSDDETDWLSYGVIESLNGNFSSAPSAIIEATKRGLTLGLNEFKSEEKNKNHWLNRLDKFNKADSSSNKAGILKVAGKKVGHAYNPNKQLYFTGVKQREFDVYFYLSPMSKKEADSIREGYKNLAMLAAPSYGEVDYFFKYPSYFNFEVNVNNVSVLKRQNLVITKVHLDFTSDGNITWHDDGFPTSMQMTVGFKELNIPTQENLEQISIFGSPFKKPDTKNSDVPVKLNPFK